MARKIIYNPQPAPATEPAPTQTAKAPQKPKRPRGRPRAAVQRTARLAMRTTPDVAAAAAEIGVERVEAAIRDAAMY